MRRDSIDSNSLQLGEAYRILMERGYNVRALTLNKDFANPDTTVNLFRQLGTEFRFEILGFLSKDDKLSAFERDGFRKYLHTDNILTSIRGKLTAQPEIEFRIVWNDPEVFSIRPQSRVDVAFYLAPKHEWNFAERLFLSMIDIMLPIWGELVDEPVTGQPTFCGPNQHTVAVPHLGTANYFGPDYVNFFGGLLEFKHAGFARVEERHGGVYVVLPEAKDEADFKQTRARVESNLGPPGLFKLKPYGPCPDFREWYEDQ